MEFNNIRSKFPELKDMDMNRLRQLKKMMAIAKMEENYDLHDYARRRDVEGVKKCLEEGADPDFIDTRKGGCRRTALHKVFMLKIKTPGERNDIDRVVKLLIDSGANIHLVDKGAYDKRDPLMWAISKDVLRSVQLLVEAGAKFGEKQISELFSYGWQQQGRETLNWVIENEKCDLQILLKKYVRHSDNLDLLRKILKKVSPPDDIWRYCLTYQYRPSVIKLLFEDGRADPTYDRNYVIKHMLSRCDVKNLNELEYMVNDPRIDLSAFDNTVLRKMVVESRYDNYFLPEKIKFVLNHCPGNDC